MSLESQLAALRASQPKPGDWRAKRRKRQACERLERKARARKVREVYEGPF